MGGGPSCQGDPGGNMCYTDINYKIAGNGDFCRSMGSEWSLYGSNKDLNTHYKAQQIQLINKGMHGVAPNTYARGNQQSCDNMCRFALKEEHGVEHRYDKAHVKSHVHSGGTCFCCYK